MEELYDRLPSPTQINLSVCPSLSHIFFNYSAENLFIPTIKATIETSWYWHRRLPSPTTINFLGIEQKKAKAQQIWSNIPKRTWLVRKNAQDQQIWSIILENSVVPPAHAPASVISVTLIWHCQKVRCDLLFLMHVRIFFLDRVGEDISTSIGRRWWRWSHWCRPRWWIGPLTIHRNWYTLCTHCRNQYY